MTRGLAIETSSRLGSVALVQDGVALASETFEHGLQHAARIVASIDQLCRQQDWRSREITEVYVSAGPGSFTGLRIGITLAKTLAFATGANVIAVPSVRVLVENAPHEPQNVVIVLDAKRGQIFTAAFQRHSDQWREQEPAHLDTLSAMLSRAPRPVQLLGEGIPYHREFIPTGGGVILTGESLWRPRAEVVARLGYESARAGHSTDPQALTPIYIRRPEAEEKLEKN